MFKVNYRNIRTSCEICSKLTIKTPERYVSNVSTVKFEQVNAGWDKYNVNKSNYEEGCLRGYKEVYEEDML